MRIAVWLGALAMGTLMAAGCQTEPAPPPQRVVVPSARNPDYPVRESIPPKPLPPRTSDTRPGPAQDSLRN